MQSKSPSLITVQSLESYFFDSLFELNKKSLCPVPREAIFYSGQILSRYLQSQDFYEINTDGKIQNKVLGLKYLEANLLPVNQKKEVFRDIGDSALFLCGYFRPSLKKQIVDLDYYKQLGISAYERLNAIVPLHYDIQSFYKMIASCFENLMILFSRLAETDKSDPLSQFLLNESSDLREALVSGAHPLQSKKVS